MNGMRRERSRDKGRKVGIWALIPLFVLGLTTLVMHAPTIGQETKGFIVISVRDVETGYALPAFVSISKEEDGQTGPIIDSFQVPLGEIVKSYPPGKYIIELKMEGYKPMKSWFVIEAGTKFRDRYMLSPIESKMKELQKELQLLEKAAIRVNMAVIRGYITDDETGQPLEGVRIVFEKTGIETYSDQKGYYEAFIPVEQRLRINDEEIKALQETIVFSLEGYKTRKEVNVLITANQLLRKNMIMFKGVGEIIEDRTPKLLLPPEKIQEIEKLKKEEIYHLSPRFETEGLNESNSNLLSASAQSLSFMKPPSTIKVGFSSTWECCSKNGVCCAKDAGGTCIKYCGSCTQAQTFDLEDYVLRGVCDEWSPSWVNFPHSIRAGTVAYRSYGAKHIVYPDGHSGTNYDICSSCACQMFDSTPEISTIKTAGIMLQKNGVIFEAEYSSVNNNYPCSGGTCSGGGYYWDSCGNGYVGRKNPRDKNGNQLPNEEWPCLRDDVSAGYTLSGHGGGMSQYGSYDWAVQGKMWSWIVNHYYNANGGADGLSSAKRTAYMTSPLQITSASPSPNSVSPGQTFTININANNYAGLSHTQIIIGASLYSSSTGYISDPSHDSKITLYTGSNNVNRYFTVPSSTPAGTYDLYVALWLDVDEDNQITTTDLLMALYYATVTVAAHTLTITSGPSGTPNPVASGGRANLSVTAADSLGHSLSYQWSSSCPTLGSNGSFSNANAQNPSWTAPTNTTGSQQNCTIRVTVSDGQGLSQTGSYSQGVSPAHTLTITSGPSGTPNPVASGGTANLSVTAVDSLGHSLSYAWTASCPTLGSNGSFSNANAQNPSWTAPTNTTGSQQNCTIRVTVSDGQGLSQTGSYSQGVSPAHTLTITSGPSGTPNPVASGGTANLSVTAADSLGHSLSYQWSSSCPTLGSNGSFSNANAQNPSWTAPTNTTGSQQNCTIRVTVSDGQGLSQTGSYSQGVSPAHTLTITSGPSGTPNPVASGGTANLSVTAADSLGHSLSYQWSSSCPTLGSNGSFSNANAQNPSWTAPTNTTGSQQNCTIRVTVSDGQGLSQTGSYSQGVSPAHTLTITSGPSGTPNPVASGGTANLSVTAADSLGHSLSYAWTASCPTLGSNGSFSNANAQNPTWTAPTNTTGSQQNCTIRVTVSDGQGLSQSGSYSQGVSPAHTLTITSGPSGTPNPVASGGTANLSVTAADSLGHSLSYAWTASCPTLGSNGSFSNANAQNPTWTAPTNTTGSQQNCTIRVTVSDGQGLSQSGSYSQGVSPVDLSGAIQVRATRNGSSWSGSVSYTLTGPTTINGASVPATFANSPTGTYTLTFNSGGPSGACLIGITPSPTQTLNPGGTITFTLNFSTSCGTIQVKATLNGASWSGSVSYTLTGPTTINGASVPATFANSPTGTYTLTYNSGGPSGATFVGITPSPTQTLLVRRTLTFTLNFSRPVDEVEPNDTTSQAQIVSIPSIVNGSASPGGDPGSNWYLDYNGNGRFDAGIDDLIEDFFRISVNVYRMTLTITLDTPNRTEANLNLYIARLVGSQLSILSWSALDGTPPERITTSLTRGTYYVIVTNFDPGPTIPTSYTLTISSSSGAGLSVSGGESQSSIRKRTGSLESLSQEFESPVVPPPPILAVVRKRLYPHGEA
jgi:hypothetical protein